MGYRRLVGKLADGFDEDAIYKSWDIKFVDDERDGGSVVEVYGVLTAVHPKVDGLDSKEVGAGFLEVTKDEKNTIYLDFRKEAERYAERMNPGDDSYSAEELHLESKTLKVKDEGKQWKLSLGVSFEVNSKSRGKRADQLKTLKFDILDVNPKGLLETVNRLTKAGIDAHAGKERIYGTIQAKDSADASRKVNQAAGYQLVSGLDISKVFRRASAVKGEKPASKWDKLPNQLRPFGWATPARNIDGTTPIPWRVAYRDWAEDWLKAKFAKYGFRDLYVESEPDTHHGANRLWVGLRDNRNKIDHYERMEQMYLILEQEGWPVLFDDRVSYAKLWIVDDLPRNVLRGKTAGSDPLRYVAANGRLLLSQDKNMRYAMMRQMFGMSTLQTDMLMNLYKQGTLQQEGPKVLSMWKRASYEGNPDGHPIYPVEVDHGYNDPVSGGTSVIKDLVYTLRKEQGRTAAQNVVLTYLTER